MSAETHGLLLAAVQVLASAPPHIPACPAVMALGAAFHPPPVTAMTIPPLLHEVFSDVIADEWEYGGYLIRLAQNLPKRRQLTVLRLASISDNAS